MRKRLHWLLGLIVMVYMFIFAACETKTNYTLTFISDGEIYQTIETNGNEVIDLPIDPTKEGYDFDGWYWDNGE